jgi:predicted outer membrane repeat protein
VWIERRDERREPVPPTTAGNHCRAGGGADSRGSHEALATVIGTPPRLWYNLVGAPSPPSHKEVAMGCAKCFLCPSPLPSAALALLAAIVASFPLAALADTYLVNPDRSGDYPTIQDAIGAAIDGDVIELGDGVFRGEGNRHIRYWGKRIIIRSRSGNPIACMIDCEMEARAFTFDRDETTEAVLDGIGITKGREFRGGALLFENASATVTNCVVSGCEAYGENVWGGGGVFLSGSAAQFSNCEFRANTGIHGGAILVDDSSTPSFDTVLFIDNTASSSGGAMICRDGSNVIVTGCTFSNNTVVGDPFAAGGAIHCFHAAMTVIQSTISGNGARHGGGIHCYDCISTITTSLIVSSLYGASVACGYASDAPSFSCSNIHGNPGGDWVDCIEEQLAVRDNLSAEPQFCSMTPDGDEHWVLQSDSPCCPDQAPGACGLIGAWPVACDVTPITAASWGLIKRSF